MLGSALLLPSPTKAEKPPVKDIPVYGGTLTIGTSNPPAIINPVLTQHSVSTSIMDLVFDSLIRVNHKGQIVPGIAKSWEISDDGLEYIFYLRQGVRFHDGIELTAEDVLFTYRLFSDPKINSPYQSNFDLVQSFQIIDNYTFKVVLLEAHPLLMHKFVLEVLPKHLLENENLKATSFNYQPVGSGAFRFESWNRKTDQIKLTANQEFFEGPPFIKNIVINIYPDNSELWAAFMRQEIDLVKFLKWEDYKLLKKDETFKTYKIPWEAYYAIVYNLDDPIVSDKNIRRAIAHAVNREKIIKAVLGEGIESAGPFHPNSIGFNSKVEPLRYDPNSAIKILKKRKWKDRDSDGVLERGRGELTIKMLVDRNNDISQEIATHIRQQLAEIGIKLIILLYDDDKELTEDYLKVNKPQAWLRLFIGIGPYVDNYYAMTNWYSNSTEFAKLWRYKNKKVDKLYEDVRIVRSKTKRADTFQNIHRVIYEDQAATFLFYPMSFHAVSSKVQNTNEFFTISMPTYTIKDWYVAPISDY